MKHKSYYQVYKATQAFEIVELRRCLEAHGGVYDWNDEANENESKPIICVGLDYYVGDVDVDKVYFDEKGNIKIHANEHDGWADMTFDPEDVMFGHLDFIVSYMREMLTEDEKVLVSQAICDLETGNHLLRHRSIEQRSMIIEVNDALDTPEDKRNERQKLIVEQVKACTVPNFEKPDYYTP